MPMQAYKHQNLYSIPTGAIADSSAGPTTGAPTVPTQTTATNLTTTTPTITMDDSQLDSSAHQQQVLPSPLIHKINHYLSTPAQQHLVSNVVYIEPFQLYSSFCERTGIQDKKFIFDSFLHYILQPVLATRELLIPLLDEQTQ
jgi:hypothetical protein